MADARRSVQYIRGRTLENTLCSEFYETSVSYKFDKLYPRANPTANLRSIVRLALELKCVVCDCATCLENKKLWSKSIATYAFNVSVFYACTGTIVDLFCSVKVPVKQIC